MRYFDLSENLYIPGRWYLGTPVDAQGQNAGDRLFLRGEPAVAATPLRVRQYQPGIPLDFSMADAGVLPVVNDRVASVFRELAPHDTQLFPIEVEGQSEPYHLVNVTRVVKCIDDPRCEYVDYWMPEDGQPERVGQYHNVVGPRIDPSKVGDARVFRPWGWTVVLLVSEEVKAALEALGATGMRFTEV